jgi:exodeoxyribonuclease-3
VPEAIHLLGTRMKIVSFNVNSIRVRLHQLKAVIEAHNPDIIGLQETKVTDDDFPVGAVNDLGYQVVFHGQKSHYGVALLSKIAAKNVQRGFAQDDETSQKRFISGVFRMQNDAELTVINGYFPQGENRAHPSKFPAKQKFYADLGRRLNDHFDPGKPLVIMGDINIAPGDNDIGIGEDNRKRWLKEGKCCFLPEEREWFAALSQWGLTDSFRLINPDEDARFSWFDYRSKGFDKEPKKGLRIDVIMTTSPLTQVCSAADIDYDIRAMMKPSDHCPIWADFDCDLA